MKKIINSGVSIILVVLLAFGTLALSCSAEGFGAPPGGGMGGGDSSLRAEARRFQISQ